MRRQGHAVGGNLGNDWEGDLRRYFGKTSVNQAYCMTEVMGGFAQCREGRYHCPPWIVPFVIERDSGRPLPRSGMQSGRGAFFDLTARTLWGGVVSADLLTISWQPCACGRTTPHIDPAITRLLDGTDDGLTCAAARDVVDAVIEGCSP